MVKTSVTRGYGLFENFLAKERAKIANRLIPPNLRASRILDIGCGVVPFFLINTKFKEKYGIDSLVKILDLKENIILKKLNIGENPNLPFKDNFFDVITMLGVLCQIEPSKLLDVLNEIRRLLKPNGRFILTTPYPGAYKLLRFMAKLRLVSPEEIEEGKGVYNQVLIAHYLEKAGFKRKKMNFGYFEMFLNNWVYADK